MMRKQETSLGRGALGGEQQCKGIQEGCVATVWGFMVIGLISGSSLANHCHSRSFLVTQALLRQEGFQHGGF